MVNLEDALVAISHARSVRRGLDLFVVLSPSGTSDSVSSVCYCEDVIDVRGLSPVSREKSDGQL